MSTISDGRHPEWCSPSDCHVYQDDVNHSSELLELDLPDCTWRARLARSDEAAFPDRPGGVELWTEIEDTVLVGNSAVTFGVPLEKIPIVAHWLLSFYYLGIAQVTENRNYFMKGVNTCG